MAECRGQTVKIAANRETSNKSPSGVCKFEASGWAAAEVKGGGTRFSEKVKSYLTARFDVDTETGRKPDLSEVATDMRTSRNTGSSRTFQRRMAYKGTSSIILFQTCLLYTSPNPRDATLSRMPSSA